MSRMGRYIFEMQEKEKEREALIHNEQPISQEEQDEIDKYNQEITHQPPNQKEYSDEALERARKGIFGG